MRVILTSVCIRGFATLRRSHASIRDAMTQPAGGANRRRADRSGDERRAGCAVVARASFEPLGANMILRTRIPAACGPKEEIVPDSGSMSKNDVGRGKNVPTQHTFPIQAF